MKRPVFVFLGVAESTTITDISLLKSQLETALASYIGQVKFYIQEQLNFSKSRYSPFHQ